MSPEQCLELRAALASNRRYAERVQMFFFHLISFSFNTDGTWYYDKNEEEEHF
jgi:hypothetical protein